MHTCSFVCNEGMVKAVSLLTCMVYILKVSKLQYSRQCSSNNKKENYKIDNGEPQTSTAATEVNYPHQEASHGKIQSSPFQESKTVSRRTAFNIKGFFFKLEQVVWNNSVEHGLVKSSVCTVDDQITR